MLIDSSALCAILLDEADGPRLSDAIEAATSRFTSPLARLETVFRVSTKLNIAVEDTSERYDRLIAEYELRVLTIGDDIARRAVQAWAIYGKGRGHQAQLNMTDCTHYALAKAHRLPLLFIGKDFGHTDIRSVLADPMR